MNKWPVGAACTKATMRPRPEPKKPDCIELRGINREDENTVRRGTKGLTTAPGPQRAAKKSEEERQNAVTAAAPSKSTARWKAGQEQYPASNPGGVGKKKGRTICL